MQERVPAKPLVFARSGCSFAGNLADDLARRLDHHGHAEQATRAAITRHIRLHDHGMKKHQVPNGEVDVDGFAEQITEQVESRS